MFQTLTLDNSLLGPMSPWTKVFLDKCPLDKGVLGQLSLGQMYQHQYFMPLSGPKTLTLRSTSEKSGFWLNLKDKFQIPVSNHTMPCLGLRNNTWKIPVLDAISKSRLRQFQSWTLSQNCDSGDLGLGQTKPLTRSGPPFWSPFGVII